MAIIMEGKGLTKTFGEGELSLTAVDHMDFAIQEGELVVILGQSGAGKSTLLNLIGGLEPISEGQLLYKGEDIAQYSKRQRTDYRRDRIGFVFQFYNLMPNLTARENVEIATTMVKGSLDPDKALESVGLTARSDHFPAQLSGGEQQRVSIARAIAKNTDLILCDEPTGALDYQTSKEILALLSRLAHEEGKTIVIVTHNSALAEMADHLLRVKNGQIVLDEHHDNPKPIEEIEW